MGVGTGGAGGAGGSLGAGAVGEEEHAGSEGEGGEDTGHVVVGWFDEVGPGGTGRKVRGERRAARCFWGLAGDRWGWMQKKKRFLPTRGRGIRRRRRIPGIGGA